MSVTATVDERPSKIDVSIPVFAEIDAAPELLGDLQFRVYGVISGPIRGGIRGQGLELQMTLLAPAAGEAAA